MRFLKDSGFVIKRTNFGETDRYLTVYSKENGKIELVAKGVRRITSRRASHIELLNHISFQAVKGRSNLLLTEVSLINPYEETKKNLDDVGSLFLMCELLERLCPFGLRNDSIYSLIDEVLQNSSVQSNGTLAHDFQVRLLSALGYWDPQRSFIDGDDLRQFIETIIERKLKSPAVFGQT